MKVKKLQNLGNKSGLKGCKYSNLNAPGTQSLRLGELPCLIVSHPPTGVIRIGLPQYESTSLTRGPNFTISQHTTRSPKRLTTTGWQKYSGTQIMLTSKWELHLVCTCLALRRKSHLQVNNICVPEYFCHPVSTDWCRSLFSCEKTDKRILRSENWCPR